LKNIEDEKMMTKREESSGNPMNKWRMDLGGGATQRLISRSQDLTLNPPGFNPAYVSSHQVLYITCILSLITLQFSNQSMFYYQNLEI
jgi:hypothetical protein